MQSCDAVQSKECRHSLDEWSLFSNPFCMMKSRTHLGERAKHGRPSLPMMARLLRLCSVVSAILLWVGHSQFSVAGLENEGDATSKPNVARQLLFELSEPGQTVVLLGSDARRQCLVTELRADGQAIDRTRSVRFQSEPAGILDIDSTGLVRPLRDGVALLSAHDESGLKAQMKFEVQQWANDPDVHFANQVVPIFTKLGCNSGGCHGKGAGQNGFKLSLLGFEAREDFGHIVLESRGRRVSTAAPDESLLLAKAVNAIPHGGGRKLEEDSHEYRLIRRWISQGLKYGDASAATVTSLQIVPAQRRMLPTTFQQLSVLARYSNGIVEDVTRTVQFEANDVEMADVSKTGLVTVKSLVGEVAVMARYQGQVATFRASVPLNDERYTWPEPRNDIDVAVLEQLRSLNIPISDLCDDATFLRRVTLDLAGRLPTLEEVRGFLAETEPNKRDRAIDRLLDSDDYAQYFANKWMLILRNRRDKPSQQSGSFAFYRWIQQSIAENRPYDEFVRSILTASGSMDIHPPVAWYRNVSDTNSRAEDTSQLFLGQRIQCARCHHHPYEKWSQSDYARMSAFFSLVKSKPGSTPDEPMVYSEIGKPRSSHPKTGQALEPAGLDGPTIELSDYQDPRGALVDWMVQANNPYFARSLANRYWKHFFGRGLVEPEDDMRVTNPASNIELLDALADHFVSSKFDLKELSRFICQSNVYQLSSQANAENIRDRKCHSRFYPKRMSAEVLLDAIDQTTVSTTNFDEMPDRTRAVSLPDTAFNSYFLSVFGRPQASTACECERTTESTLAQSLQLANSKELQAKLAADQSRPAILAKDQHRSDAEKIEELYLVAFARVPDDSEKKAALDYLQGTPDKRNAYEDIFWALINSKEFAFNH
jgi:Protein of unknown function (DUF1553)/Protein of unknown function (DUF1549)